MSIQKININGVDVEIEDVSARTNISNLTSEVNTLDGRVTTLENNPGGGGGGGSEWVELTTINGEAEITQEFSEIRMVCICNSSGYIYSVSCNYDSTIFPNTQGERKFVCGNPISSGYGCKFKYSVTSDGKKYVNINSCYDGAITYNYSFKAWIKPTTNKQ